MSSAFISYRRDDSVMEAGRLADTIRTQFGNGSVFIDTSDIAAGETWPDRLRSAIGEAAVVVAVIGPEWILASDEWGRRHIDDPGDWVRREIEMCLQFDKVLMPLLVRHARMIPAHALPLEIGALSSRQAIMMRNAEWPRDVEYVLGQLEPHLGSRTAGAVEPEPEPVPAAVAADLRSLSAGFASPDVAERVETAERIAEVAPGVTLDDVLNFCLVGKTSERVAGTIALGVHIRSSSEIAADPQVQSALRKLIDDRSSLVRYRAAELLAKSPALVPAYEDGLERLARSDNNVYVREIAAKALARART